MRPEIHYLHYNWPAKPVISCSKRRSTASGLLRDKLSMYKSKSDFTFQQSFCCGYKLEEKSPIKEISNPMPLDSIFRNDAGSNAVQPKGNNTKKNEYYLPNNNSTFPRVGRNTLPQTPIEKLDRIDLLINQVKDSLYQEIVDEDKSNVNHLKSPKPNTSNQLKTTESKKDVDLVFVTSRILVAYSSHPCQGENSRVIRSLKLQYKKNLKIFYLNVRSTMEDQDKTSLNTVSSLQHLMPFLDDIYNFLSSVAVWLHKSRKNIILLNCSEKSDHICAVCVRFILLYEETNRRLLKTDSLILSDHESNALQFYEKVKLERYHTVSLKRYTSTVSNIMLNIINYQPNLRHLHIIVLKNIHYIDRHYEGVKENSKMSSEKRSSSLELRSIYINVYQNFHLLQTSYKVILNEELETDRVFFIIDPIVPLNGDILIIASVTDSMGFQSIYFRLQFHTCLLNGDLASFKYSELDRSSNKDLYTRRIGLMELHLKNQPSLVRDHENMLLSSKYFIVKEKGNQSRDIFSQLKLLDQSDKSDVMSYTAGPVDGSLYAAIPKPSKSAEKIDKNDIVRPANTVKVSLEEVMKTPSVLSKFQKLEKEITNAAEQISTTTSKRINGLPDQNLSKSYFNSNETNVVPRGSTVRTVKGQQRSFLPYRKSYSLSNADMPLKFEKEDREYFISYGIVTPKTTISKKSVCTNANVDADNFSPYDNLFPHNTVQQCSKYRDATDNHYNPASRMHESNYELVSPTNDEDIHHEFISNLNELRIMKYAHESIKSSHSILSEDVNQMKISNVQLYDNHSTSASNEVYNVSSAQNLWFKPNFSRQDAILHLLSQPVGYFVIRTSTSLSKSLSIVIKCSTSIMNNNVIENDSLDHIRHFIIDYNTEGYKIRGFTNEKYYSDLPKLIHDHMDKKIGLPCHLVLPPSDKEKKELLFKEYYTCQDRYLQNKLSTTIVSNHNVVYLGSFITKNLCDITSISASIDTLQERICKVAHEYSSNSLTRMSLRITHDRIIFTDLNRKMFFRKHCKLEDILCCEVDPKRRVWSHMMTPSNSPSIPSLSPIFGLVSCLTANTEFSNQTCCQLFLTLGYDAEDLCSAVNQARSSVHK